MNVVVICSACLSLLFLMPLMAQPLSLGLCIMILSSFSCILLGVMTSSWYGYILFLIYVGGLLVMFAYVSALAPNNFFSSAKSLFGGFIILVLMLSILGLVSVPASSFMVSNLNVSMSKITASFGGTIVSPSSISLMILMGVVLLINLLAVVKVCYYQQGPLRSHFELK
uniref:NADH-ubiquinone oxidoreductase chain 6 n=1 Tax=Rochia nilotica TaxID=2709805 RepID=A0A6G9IFA1_9VEST|nr:NADH dehydrogenase subunit 6 [Rochia nilotica]